MSREFGYPKSYNRISLELPSALRQETMETQYPESRRDQVLQEALAEACLLGEWAMGKYREADVPPVGLYCGDELITEGWDILYRRGRNEVFDQYGGKTTSRSFEGICRLENDLLVSVYRDDTPQPGWQIRGEISPINCEDIKYSLVDVRNERSFGALGDEPGQEEALIQELTGRVIAHVDNRVNGILPALPRSIRYR
jgi:hypothetical protein